MASSVDTYSQEWTYVKNAKSSAASDDSRGGGAADDVASDFRLAQDAMPINHDKVREAAAEARALLDFGSMFGQGQRTDDAREAPSHSSEPGWRTEVARVMGTNPGNGQDGSELASPLAIAAAHRDEQPVQQTVSTDAAQSVGASVAAVVAEEHAMPEPAPPAPAQEGPAKEGLSLIHI